MERDITKEIDAMFFFTLKDLLRQYIYKHWGKDYKPSKEEENQSAEKLAHEIYNGVKDICRSNGYWFDLRYHSSGTTYTIEKKLSENLCK